MRKLLNAFLWVSANLRLDNPNDELCCIFVRAVLSRRYGEQVVAKSPVKLWFLWPEAGDPWGPVTAAVQAGIATKVTAPLPGRAHIAQVWRGTPLADGSVGHTFLWYESPDGSGGIRLDSADNRKGDGDILDSREDGPAICQTDWSAITKDRTFAIAVLEGAIE